MHPVPCDGPPIGTDAPHSLLELQRIDSSAHALRVRLEALPERKAIADCDASLVALAARRVRLLQERAELSRQERQIAQQAAELGTRLAEMEAHLYSGKVTSPKELAGRQGELDAMKRRKREVEEQEYGLLERGEQADQTMVALDAEEQAQHATRETLQKALDVAAAGIEAELADLAAARATVVGELSEVVVAAYTKRRIEAGPAGTVVALFVGETCRGCNTTIPIVDATRIRREPSTSLAQCPRCRRLLVV